MIKSLGMAALALALSGAAMASDLPSRAPAPAPVFAAAPAAVTSGFYAGVRGTYATEAAKGSLGGNAGYEFGALRVEGDYDRLGLGKTGANLATANVIYGYKLGNLTPYVLGGAGVKSADGFKADANHAVYNVGGGVRFAVTEKIELDARYRFVQAIRKDAFGDRAYDHLLTAGVNYKF